MKRTRRVLIATTWEEPGQLIGIWRVAQRAGWSIRQVGPLDARAVAEWKPDGIICQLYHNNPELVEAVFEAKVPTVELHDYIADMKVPRVLVDPEEAGRMGAEHFLECGFRRFIHAGTSRARARWRCTAHGFERRLAGEGVRVERVDFDDPVFWRSLGVENESGLSWELCRQGSEAFARWIVQDSEPAAIFCEEPQIALDLVDAGTGAGLHIPEQFAVLMLRTLPHENELAQIPISNIAWDFIAQGACAAETLDLAMQGDSVPDVQWIPPLPVEIRESTDTIATSFYPAAMAMRHFRKHALEYSFTPQRAAEDLGISMKTLHRWFKNHAGRTPAAMIAERRLDHAVRLLRSRPLGLEEAAQQSGFTGALHLRRTMKRLIGVEPRTLKCVILDGPGFGA